MGRPSVLKVDIVADARGVKTGTADADRELGKLGRNAGKHGEVVRAGMLAAAAGVGVLVGSSIKAASDLEQSQGAVESVFGKTAAAVKAYSSTSATAVGLSANSYNTLAAVVGSQLQGMGVSQDKSAAKTNDLIKTGADLAATYGGSVSDAVEAVGSLLRGERDPIEKYGVSITAADVAARLAAKGQGDLQGAALKTAQAQATLELLTTKTANAHGAFGRESDTLAHQQQVLGAQFEDVRAKLGTKLLPVLTAAGQQLVKTADFVQRNQRVIVPLVGALGGLAAVVYTVNTAARVYKATQAALNVVMSLNPVALVVIAIAALVAGVVLAYRHSEKFRAGVDGLWSILKRFIGFTPLGALILHFGTVREAVDAVVDAVKSVIDWIGRIHFPSPPGWMKGAVSFVTGSTPVTTGLPQLTGGSPGLDRQLGGLATAAVGAGPDTWTGVGGMGGGALVVVDRRDFSTSVQVDGALDGPGVARQLAELLDDHAVRLGHLTAYAPAR